MLLSSARRRLVNQSAQGFSGNLGFGLSPNWAFSQIATINVGSGSAVINIDNDIASGRDPGQWAVSAPSVQLDGVFNMSYKTALYNDVNAYQSQVTSNQLGLIHSMNDALDVIMDYDLYITTLASTYGVHKALIQSEAFWEYWKETVTDPLADGLVEDWYAYEEEEEAWESFPLGDPPTPPIVVRTDCSTGISQIFASTAISARNWASDAGLTSDSQLNASDWHTVWNVWQDLHNDGFYNIGTVPLVLFWGASEVGIVGPRLDYSPTDLQDIFARYNGVGSGAVQYGQEVYGVYQIFDYYNQLSN